MKAYKRSTRVAQLIQEQVAKIFHDIKELLEENAELKKQIENFQKYLDSRNCYRGCAETWEKLTKAKELIRQLCSMVRELNKPNIQLTNVDYSLSEAEQFLANNF